MVGRFIIGCIIVVLDDTTMCVCLMNTFMAHYLKNVFHNSNWIMPMLVMGGKKTRQTRRNTPAFYVPNGVRLNVGYQTNSGVSIDDL